MTQKSTETQIKYWQSRLAHAIEDKETAERKLRDLGVGPEPEVVPPDEWYPATEPPDSARDVFVKMKDGKTIGGYWLPKIGWNIYYSDAEFLFEDEMLRPGDTVVSWKEIDLTPPHPPRKVRGVRFHMKRHFNEYSVILTQWHKFTNYGRDQGKFRERV